MIANFFIDRPVFATVISIVIVLLGLVALVGLPIAQYPEVAPPTIQVTALYPGASAKVVAETVATPIEQEINGVERMLYMSSRSTNDGQVTIDITFQLGTNLDMAQVLVQNRVAIAEAKLPDEVKRQGVTTKKKSPSILLCVNLISPGGEYDQLYLSNYATLQLKDALARIDGVGDVTFLGARDYSMRVWLDPDKLAARSLGATDVLRALQEQNVQVAAGRLGQPPAPAGLDFQLSINTLGRLLSPAEFGEVIIKTGAAGQVTRLKDVARIDLGAKNYDVSSYLDGMPSVTMAVFQLPGSNALATAELIRAEMEKLKQDFKPGVEYRIVYDTTVFIEESVHDVYKTLIEAFVLVFLVVLLFLQDWRATLLPMIDVPVSLIGTLFVMSLLGFSLNNLTLFGLVLAIGIVVDDAIVVLENIERWMEKGLAAREAARQAMAEITGPVIAITLVLCSVFIPTAMLAGISGQFYRQFALTIAASTIISAINAMTMTPSRAVQILKSEHSGHAHQKEALPRWGIALLLGLAAVALLAERVAGLLHIALPGEHGAPAGADGWLTPWRGVQLGSFAVAAVVGWIVAPWIQRGLAIFFRGFNRAFDLAGRIYGSVIARLLRVSAIMLLVYAGLIGLTWFGFRTVPVGFIPQQDKGYLVLNAQLPDGASLERTEQLMERIDAQVRATPGVAHTLRVPGYSVLTSANQSNLGAMFIILDSFHNRAGNPDLYSAAITARLQKEFYSVPEGIVVVFGAPPVEGVGTTGGFKLQVQDRAGATPAVLQGAVENVIAKASAQPQLTSMFSSFRASQPQIYLDIDRTKAKTEGVSLDDVFATLQTYLGSAYVNDFTEFNRNWQVNVQADAPFRASRDDVLRLRVRNAEGNMVPLGTLVTIRDVTGPAAVNHYNLYPSAEVTGNTTVGTSSGEAITLMEQICREELPPGMSFEWTELTLQQILASQDLLTKLVFPLGVIFVFMVLAAQYESWSLPMAIMLIVPMCLLAAITGVWIASLQNDIFTQIGLIVLVALAAKNAILIVEFAKQREDAGEDRATAIVESARLRLRPILMTSLAFILGVVPLVLAEGAGAEMRVSLGVAVFSGMLGVTIFGLFFTPIFYQTIMRFTKRRAAPSAAQTHIAPPASPPPTAS